MKKILKKFGLALLLLNAALTINMQIVLAGNPDTPTAPSQPSIYSPVEFLKRVGNGTKLPSYLEEGQHPDAPSNYIEAGVGTVTSPILFVIDIMRFIMSGIALLVVILAAIKLISTGDEGEAEKQKDALIYGIIGLLLIQLADAVVKKMFFGEQGEAFENAALAEQFGKESVSIIRGIIGLVEIFVGVVSVFVLIIRGFVLLTSFGEEEDLTTAKNHVIYAIAGLIVVGLSEVIVRGFVFPENGTRLPNVEAGKKILIDMTNYFSGFIAIFAFAVLFYSGYRYVVSAGNDEITEKVKKTVYGAVIALALALGAFALVNTFVTLDSSVDTEETNLTENSS